MTKRTHPRGIEASCKRQLRRADSILASQFVQDETNVIGPPAQPGRVGFLRWRQSLNSAGRWRRPSFWRQQNVASAWKDRERRFMGVRDCGHDVAMTSQIF